MKKIAIQGIRGSFHHIAAESFFGKDIVLEECLNFADIPKCISQNQADFGIMAIENSIAGALLPNYALIDTHHLSIIGECYLHIEHHLMALARQDIQNIKQIHSHPMALLQCSDFLEQYPHIRLIEDKDTAYAAQRVAQQDIHGAVIAPVLAAEMYQLKIVASGIQNIKRNYTRFFVVAKKLNALKHGTKASLKFVLKHQIGSLGSILNIFAEHNVNLSKIQSLPIIEKPWEYAFFTDLIFEDPKDYQKALLDLKSKVSHCKVLGVYQNNNYNV